MSSDLERTIGARVTIKGPLNVELLRETFKEVYKKAVEDQVEEKFREPFDLTSGEPIYRAYLFSVSAAEHHLFMIFHHLAIDGWGTSLLFTRLTEDYNAKVSGRGRAGGMPIPDRQTITSDGGSGCARAVNRKVKFSIDKTRFDEVLVFTRRSKSTIFHVLIAAIYRLLASTRSKEGLVFGLPLLNKSNGGFKKTIGRFTTISLLRIDDPLSASFDTLLRSIASSLKKLYRRQFFPPGEIFTTRDYPDPGARTVCDVVFSYEKYDYPANFQDCDCRVILIGNELNPSHVNVHVREFAEDGNVQVDMNYDPAAFPELFMDNFGLYLSNFFDNLVEQNNGAMCETGYISLLEKAMLLYGYNDMAQVYPVSSNLICRLRSMAASFGDCSAVQCKGKVICYGKLLDAADRVSRMIGETIREGGHEVIGLMSTRSEWLIIYMLAIFKSGCGVIPLDPQMPSGRIQHIIRDSSMRCCLADEEFMYLLSSDISSISTESLRENLTGFPEIAIPWQTNLRGDDIAYCMYTSGSAGVSKGVEIEYHSLNNLLNGMSQAFAIRPGDRFLAITSISFDTSLLEFLLPLFNGAEVILADEAESKDVLILIELIKRTRPAFIQATPEMWMLLLDHGKDLFRQTVALCGGGDLPPMLAVRLAENTLAAYNMYGATETTIWSVMARIEPGEVVIGKPIGNTYSYILNYAGELVPPGVVGELFIGGEGVGRGYRNNPGLTKERFLPNPHRNGERFYRTGDLCSREKNGNIRFMGKVEVS